MKETVNPHWFALAWRRRRIRLVLTLLLGVAALLFAWWLYVTFSARDLFPTKVMRASKKARGTYEMVVQTIGAVLGRYPDELGFKLQLEEPESEGSVKTLELLERDELDMGIIQGDTEIRSTAAGIVAELYSETFLLFARPGVNSWLELLSECRKGNRRVRVACLGPGSQSRIDMALVFEFYGLADSEYELVAADYPGSVKMASDGTVDAAFFITGIGHAKVVELAKTPNVSLLALPGAVTLAGRFRGVERTGWPRTLLDLATRPRLWRRCGPPRYLLPVPGSPRSRLVALRPRCLRTGGKSRSTYRFLK